MSAQKTAARDPFFDNAKFLLIALVVLGHGMELVGGRVTDVLYKLIYLFHMPAFVLILGFFSARQKNKKTADAVLQYLIFQIIYTYAAAIGNRTAIGEVKLSFLFPVWVMWFSLSSMGWKYMAPFVVQKLGAKSLIFAVVVALAAGLFPWVGYGLSLSRTLVFFPFFLLGFLAEEQNIAKIKSIPFWAGLLAFSLSFVLLFFIELPAPFLYGSSHYARFGFTFSTGMAARLGVLCWGFLLVLAFFSLVPKKTLPITKLGANTMQVFLLHGLVLLAFRPFITPWLGGGVYNQAVFYLGLVVLLFAFSSNAAAYLTRPFTAPWQFGQKLLRPRGQKDEG